VFGRANDSVLIVSEAFAARAYFLPELFMHWMPCAFCFALPSAGRSIDAKIAMMAMDHEQLDEREGVSGFHALHDHLIFRVARSCSQTRSRLVGEGAKGCWKR
jgi:hypothetical protein